MTVPGQAKPATLPPGAIVVEGPAPPPAGASKELQDAYAKDNTLPRPDHNIVLESLVPYVRGERSVIIRADREAEIRGAIKFADPQKALIALIAKKRAALQPGAAR